MAKGLKCPECSYPCWAEKEEFQPKGTWVHYVCQNRSCASHKRGYPWRDKRFEGN